MTRKVEARNGHSSPSNLMSAALYRQVSRWMVQASKSAQILVVAQGERSMVVHSFSGGAMRLGPPSVQGRGA